MQAVAWVLPPVGTKQVFECLVLILQSGVFGGKGK